MFNWFSLFFMYFFFLCLALSIMLFILSYVFSYKNPDKEKNSTYECGFSPIKNTGSPFSIKFFVVGMIFLVFDLEILMLYSLPGNYIDSSISEYITMEMFLLLIIISLIFEWCNGSLEWENLMIIYFFWLFAILMSSIMISTKKNMIYSLFWFMLLIFSMYFYLFFNNIHFLSLLMSQIYMGAMVVLFSFSMLMVDSNVNKKGNHSNYMFFLFIFLMMIFFIYHNININNIEGSFYYKDFLTKLSSYEKEDYLVFNYILIKNKMVLIGLGMMLCVPMLAVINLL